MAWNSIADRVQRSPTGPLAREIRSTAESIGFGVIAVSRLSAQNTIRQEDSGILCLPLPCPVRERRTCPTSTPGGNLPVRRPPVVPPCSAAWPPPSSRNRFTTGRLNHLWPGLFPILPFDFTYQDGKHVDYLSSSLPRDIAAIFPTIYPLSMNLRWVEIELLIPLWIRNVNDPDDSIRNVYRRIRGHAFNSAILLTLFYYHINCLLEWLQNKPVNIYIWHL